MTARTAVAAQRRPLVALVYGAICHGGFLIAVTSTAIGLTTGLRSGLGRLDGTSAWVANLVLLLQFPILHSLGLTRLGARVLRAFAPGDTGRELQTTLFATLASLQLIATFVLWTPTGPILYEAEGLARVLLDAACAGSWLFLGKALWDAGLGLQTGWIGWSALWRGARPAYPPMPVDGLFARCRQPIYLGFALVIWAGPVWTLDRLLVALVWSAYCFVGPRLKERRFASIHGEAFDDYQRRVPYFFPRLRT